MIKQETQEKTKFNSYCMYCGISGNICFLNYPECYPSKCEDFSDYRFEDDN